MTEEKPKQRSTPDPYRERRTPPHLGKADFKDGRDHPEAREQHYGENPVEGPQKGGSPKPPLPAVKTQR